MDDDSNEKKKNAFLSFCHLHLSQCVFSLSSLSIFDLWNCLCFVFEYKWVFCVCVYKRFWVSTHRPCYFFVWISQTQQIWTRRLRQLLIRNNQIIFQTTSTFFLFFLCFDGLYIFRGHSHTEEEEEVGVRGQRLFDCLALYPGLKRKLREKELFSFRMRTLIVCVSVCLAACLVRSQFLIRITFLSFFFFSRVQTIATQSQLIRFWNLPFAAWHKKMHSENKDDNEDEGKVEGWDVAGTGKKSRTNDEHMAKMGQIYYPFLVCLNKFILPAYERSTRTKYETNAKKNRRFNNQN